MKMSLFTFVLLVSLVARGEILQFDVSPSGSTAAIGLSPWNEVIPPDSSGSGGEITPGITFDTVTRILRLNVGYGSSSGFSDLSGAAFSWLLHGPANGTETAPVIFDLASIHSFAQDHSHGGVISGNLQYNSAQAADLLSGLHYINIYTLDNLGGELRGQLVAVPEPTAWYLTIAAVTSIGATRMLCRRSKHANGSKRCT